MAYQTGTSTGPTDLLDKLRVFLVAQGWTVNGWTDDGTGKRLHVQKTAGDSTVMYFNFKSSVGEYGAAISEEDYNGALGAVTGICVNGSTGYNGSNSWDKQPGYPQNIDYSNKSMACCMSPLSTTAIPSYHFFTVDDAVHVAVEETSGKYQFMSFGLLNKQGIYTGGQYFTASYSTRYPYQDWDTGNYAPNFFSYCTAGYHHGAAYLDVDGTADWRVSQASGTGEIIFPCVTLQEANENYSQAGLCSYFWSHSPSSYNGMAAMCPIHVLGKRSDNNYSNLGWPPGVRFLNVQFYQPGQEHTYGSETWLSFPNNGKNSVTPKNLYTGFAFRKIV